MISLMKITTRQNLRKIWPVILLLGTPDDQRDWGDQW